MVRLLFQIFTINCKEILFTADSVESDETTHRFWVDGEIRAEFERKNIAGYCASEEEDGDCSE